MLILGHISRASCLTEVCDDADLNRGKLRLVRNATPGRRNTFSHANRTRPAEASEEVCWETVWLTAADTARKHPETIVEPLRLYGTASPPRRPRPQDKFRIFKTEVKGSRLDWTDCRRLLMI